MVCPNGENYLNKNAYYTHSITEMYITERTYLVVDEQRRRKEKQRRREEQQCRQTDLQ